MFVKDKGYRKFSDKCSANILCYFFEMPVDNDMKLKIEVLAKWIKTQAHLPQSIGM